MTELLWLVKASVVVLSTALALALVGRRASAASRHLLCTLAIAGLLALPILSWVLPGWSTVRLPAYLAHVDQSDVDQSDVEQDATTGFIEAAGHHVTRRTLANAVDLESSPSAAMSFMAVLTSLAWSRLFWVLLYAGGMLLFIMRLFVDRFAVRRLVRHATELRDPEWQTLFRECANQLDVPGEVRLLRSRERATPMAVGIRHRAIVVPALADAWPDEMRRAVLLHELAHVARRDCLTQTAAAFACAVYWAHPGSWWLARRLRIERELACDDLVLSTGTDARDYASHLLEIAYTLPGRVAPALAVGMATPHQLETRMLALLDRARNRTVPSRLRCAAAFVIVIALMLPVSTATAVTIGPADDGAEVAQAQEAREVGPEMLRRFLTVEYWRQTATVQLSRLADQLNYLSEMRQLGYSVVDVDVLFKLRQRGVTPDLVRELAAEGLSNLPADDLLEAANHGINPEYVRDLKGLGFWPLDMNALTRMRSHGIDGDFIRDLRTFGYRWSIDSLVQARSHGIDPDFLLALSSLGYEQLTLDELTLLRSHGVTPMRIRSANERAGTHLSVNQLTTLASHGWKP